MAEPFKTWFNPEMIGALGDALAEVEPDFDRARFVALATHDLDSLELRARSRRITAALTACLPDDFPAAASRLVAALRPDGGEGGVAGWAIMPMADYIAEHGMADFDLSLDALGEMTKRLTAEFAIRPFLAKDPERALRRLTAWARDPDPRLRRLASEGARPRLPWGIRLNDFVRDPAPLIPLLTLMRDDPSEDVRRSVANNHQ